MYIIMYRVASLLSTRIRPTKTRVAPVARDRMGRAQRNPSYDWLIFSLTHVIDGAGLADIDDRRIHGHRLPGFPVGLNGDAGTFPHRKTRLNCR